jgi:hypothetical protein
MMQTVSQYLAWVSPDVLAFVVLWLNHRGYRRSVSDGLNKLRSVGVQLSKDQEARLAGDTALESLRNSAYLPGILCVSGQISAAAFATNMVPALCIIAVVLAMYCVDLTLVLRCKLADTAESLSGGLGPTRKVHNVLASIYIGLGLIAKILLRIGT